MTKAPLKPRPRPSALEALRVVATQTPTLPPATIERADRATTLNLRLRQSTVEAIAREAKARGLTIKQLIMEGAKSVGVPIAPSDLEDRTPRRKHAM
jgi:predicted DNA binding CopG/RHH family protein